MERQKTPNSHHNTEREKKLGLVLLNLKTYYKATVAKTVWHWSIDKPMGQKQRDHNYRKLIFDK